MELAIATLLFILLVCLGMIIRGGKMTSDELRRVTEDLLLRFGTRPKMRDSTQLADRASRRLGQPVAREAVEALLTDYAARGKLTIVYPEGSDSMLVHHIDPTFLAKLAVRRAAKNPVVPEGEPS